MSVTLRILLRYLAALLVAKGLIAPEMGDLLAVDPDIVTGLEAVLGVMIGAAVEGWYVLARRFGWAR